MKKNILYANQMKPYELIKNIFKHNSQYKEYLYIAKRNLPDFSIEDIVKMFKDLSDRGCTCSVVANAIGEFFYHNDEEFINTFGYSLITSSGFIDYNRILVDVFSRLYDKAKVKFFEYESYVFDSIKDAGKKLLGYDLQDDRAIVLALFDNGIMLDGLTENKKIKLKKIKPIIEEYIGTVKEISMKKFGVECDTLEKLSKICENRNIEISYKYTEIEEKLSGLLPMHFNFWIDYYFQSCGINCTIESHEIIKVKDYREFQQYIMNLTNDGDLVEVSVGANDEVKMHTNKIFSWCILGGRLGEYKGHAMLFRGFNVDGDIVVSSWGQDYIIPKEYYNVLEFRRLMKQVKSRSFENDNLKITRIN